MRSPEKFKTDQLVRFNYTTKPGRCQVHPEIRSEKIRFLFFRSMFDGIMIRNGRFSPPPGQHFIERSAEKPLRQPADGGEIRFRPRKVDSLRQTAAAGELIPDPPVLRPTGSTVPVMELFRQESCAASAMDAFRIDPGGPPFSFRERKRKHWNSGENGCRL